MVFAHVDQTGVESPSGGEHPRGPRRARGLVVRHISIDSLADDGGNGYALIRRQTPNPPYLLLRE